MKLLYDYALTFCNIPYKWGGNDPMEGLDCSGLIRILLKVEGFSLTGLNAQGIYDHFKDKNNGAAVDMGTLIFYGKDVKSIYHVALALDSYRHIEAAGGDHTTTNLQMAETQNAFVRITPIRSDYIASLIPDYQYKDEEYP